ncbi:MAG: PilN domain-containing protein [Pseudomonadota bacterium]
MIRINLLPTKATRKKESVIFQLVSAAVVIAVGLGVCWFVNRSKQSEIDNEQVNINDLQAKINQLQGIIKQVEDFKQKKRDLNAKIDTIKKLNQQRSGPVKLMEEFTYVVPRKAWVTTFRETNKQLTLEGVAADGAVVADLVDNLRGSKYFQDVQLIQVQSGDASGKKAQRFSINCRVDYTPPGKI